MRQKAHELVRFCRPKLSKLAWQAQGAQIFAHSANKKLPLDLFVNVCYHTYIKQKAAYYQGDISNV